MAGAAVVVGLGTSGRAAARWLVARGHEVVAVDDSPTEETRVAAGDLGIPLVERPSARALTELVREAEVVVPSPGVPVRHPVFDAARRAGVPLRGEIELAATEMTATVVAITGTNGKTTVTALTTEMLRASGRTAIAAGNIGLPLTEAAARPADVVVVEVSSFQLELTASFHPTVAVWLNFAEDHLDWHPDLGSYAAAKSRIWANQADGDVAVANADDAEVMRWASRAPVAVTTFGLGRADYHVAGGSLRTPDGQPIVAIASLGTALPHDVANGLAASAAALAAGATVDGVRRALLEFDRLPHRVTLVGESGGVRWYDDSKATNPHATLSALRGFDSVVLVAGGRNKGLDLTPLVEAVDHVRAVVAIGEAGPDVARAFASRRPVTVVDSMDEAVRVADAAARPGDAVLLSPACASFDRYRSYAERGDDFVRAVAELLGARSGS